MIKVFYNYEFFNVDNSIDEQRAIKSGAKEISSDILIKYGIKGYENFVCPNNTKLLPNGDIEFILSDREKAIAESLKDMVDE